MPTGDGPVPYSSLKEKPLDSPAWESSSFAFAGLYYGLI